MERGAILKNQSFNQAEELAIPKTAGFPIVGSVPNVLRKQTDYLFEAWQTYGDIYELDLGAVNIVMLNHPDFAQYVMRDNFRNYAKGGEMWASVRRLIGDGLVTAEGDVWRRQRRMLQPQFHRQHLAGLTRLMNEAIIDGMREWDALAESGEAFDISKAFSNITMRVIVRTMFGGNISAEEIDTLSEKFTFALDFMLKDMIVGNLPEWMPIPGRKVYRAVQAYIDNYIYRVIEERRKNPDNEAGDLITLMLNLVDDETGEQMSDKQLRDEAVTIFLAGYETTSIAMTWAAYMLTQNPDARRKLNWQVDTVLEGRTPQFEDLMGLTYPRMVMEEATRLYPPAYWLPRTAVEDDVIAGYKIKAGQMVAVVPLTIHRHTDFWENPDEFDPERFDPENAKGRHPLAWMPFGAGQRLCIGKDFALMEGALILSHLAQRYTVHDVPEKQPELGLSTTLTTKNGMWLRLEKR